MAEIELWAAQRFKDSGIPTFKARVAHRALEEILALDSSTDPLYRGLSIITVGRLPSDYRTISGDSVLKDSMKQLCT